MSISGTHNLHRRRPHSESNLNLPWLNGPGLYWKSPGSVYFAYFDTGPNPRYVDRSLPAHNSGSPFRQISIRPSNSVGIEGGITSGVFVEVSGFMDLPIGAARRPH